MEKYLKGNGRDASHRHLYTCVLSQFPLRVYTVANTASLSPTDSKTNNTYIWYVPVPLSSPHSLAVPLTSRPPHSPAGLPTSRPTERPPLSRCIAYLTSHSRWSDFDSPR